MWKEVEDREADETRMEEIGRERKEEGNEKVNDRQRDSNSKNSGRERRGV